MKVTREREELAEFIEDLRSQLLELARGSADEETMEVTARFREEAFTELVLGILEEIGEVTEPHVCHFEAKPGRGRARVTGWAIDEDGGQVTLVTTLWDGLPDGPRTVPADDLRLAVRQATAAWEAARKGFHRKMEPSSDAWDMMERLWKVSETDPQVRIVVLCDGTVTDRIRKEIEEVDGELPAAHVWDLRRLRRVAISGRGPEPIEIDLATMLDGGMPCVEAPRVSETYRTYLAVVPGQFLHDIYEKYGQRLLELNVRSFLQARGKVNKGIRRTLQEEPEYFLAYNNGISATAEAAEVGRGADGIRLVSIRGLQIVNGGQTVASIHRAGRRDRIDLSRVYVQMKLTVVSGGELDRIVPKISRYANTQNRVNEADFSANHPFHVKMEQLSRKIWAPGEQTRWFYERSRGQYEVALQREGTTPARRRKFKEENPRSQLVKKTDLAKYLNAWDELPHVVSLGAQKNFVRFMERLAKERGRDWEPDEKFFREAMAKAILYRGAERIARQLGIRSYRANIVAYTVALLAYRTAGRLKLEEIWKAQSLPGIVAATIEEWMPAVAEAIIESAAGRNVTEWCKKSECWRRIQVLDVEIPAVLRKVLEKDQPLPTVGLRKVGGARKLSRADQDRIARVMQVSADEWFHIVKWGARTGKLAEWQCGIATTLGGYAAMGWTQVPSAKQAYQAVKILKIAEDNGARLRQVAGDE